jgi:hypothetical protein
MTIPPQISLSANAARYAAVAVANEIRRLETELGDLPDEDEDTRSEIEMEITFYEAILRQLRGE